MPGDAPAGAVRRPVQAAEHVEQRGGLPRRRRDRSGPGTPGASGRNRADGRHESGAAQAPVRPDVAGRGARTGHLHAGSSGLHREPGSSPHTGDGELRAPGRDVRRGDRGRGGERRGDQPAAPRHRKHGVRAPCAGTGLPAGRHRSRRRHRRGRGNEDGARPRRRGHGYRIRDQQVPGRSGSVHRRNPDDRRSHGMAVPGDHTVAGGCAQPAAGRRNGPRCRRPDTTSIRRSADQNRRADALESRKLRRHGSAPNGAGGALLVRAAGHTAPARRRRGGAAGHEIDPRRSRVHALAGLGPRRPGPRTKRRTGARAVRWVPDAGPPGVRPLRRRRPGGRSSRPGAAGRDDGNAG